MPALFTRMAVLERLIQWVHSILLFQITKLDISIILNVCDRLVTSLLKVLLICIEPSLDLGVFRHEVSLTEVDFHVSDEVTSPSDQNGIDEKHCSTSEIMQQDRCDDIPTEALWEWVVLDLLSRCAPFKRTRGLTASHGVWSGWFHIGDAEFYVTYVVTLFVRSQFTLAAKAGRFTAATKAEALFLEVLDAPCIPDQHCEEEGHVAQV